MEFLLLFLTFTVSLVDLFCARLCYFEGDSMNNISIMGYLDANKLLVFS